MSAGAFAFGVVEDAAGEEDGEEEEEDDEDGSEDDEDAIASVGREDGVALCAPGAAVSSPRASTARLTKA